MATTLLYINYVNETHLYVELENLQVRESLSFEGSQLLVCSRGSSSSCLSQALANSTAPCSEQPIAKAASSPEGPQPHPAESTQWERQAVGLGHSTCVC